ncbi:MAG: TlpA family protein disulfide reductase [Candidatus Nanopelagicales bacterium]
MTGLYVLLAVVVAAAAFGFYRKRTDGRVTSAPASASAAPERLLTAETLGRPLGEQATLVQFSSAFCSPCRATRRILTDIGATVPGVEFIEVDAEEHLDLVRAVGVTRTPTVFLLDAEGDVRNRVVGQPRKDDVLAALAPVGATTN